MPGRRLSKLSRLDRKSTFGRSIAKVTAVIFLGISVVSGILGILQVVGTRYLVAGAIILLALCGWGVAFYVSLSDETVETAASVLVKAISKKLPIAYLENWLRSTLLNTGALSVYWHADQQLSVREIRCDTVLSSNDAFLRIGFLGSNGSREPAAGCPMVMFGGSVINLTHFQQNAFWISSTSKETRLHIRNILDLGQVHVVEMLFPVPIERRNDFHVEHRHAWPGGMADGEDTLWYPYAALFEERPERMFISVTFPDAPSYLRGVRTSMKAGTCEIPDAQPKAKEEGGCTFEWLIEPVDNDCIYGLAFDLGMGSP